MAGIEYSFLLWVYAGMILRQDAYKGVYIRGMRKQLTQIVQLQ